MKKCEVQTMKRVRLSAVVVLLCSLGVRAQEPSLPPPPPTAPPLVQGDEAPANAEGVLQPTEIANPPLEAQEANPTRLPRIGIEVAIGLGAGVLGGVAGGFIGSATIPRDALQPLGGTWFAASVGFAVLAPIGVWVAGKWFDGNGAWWATLLGDLAGSAIGAFSVIFGGVESTPILFALPLAGSIIGYEATSDASATLAASKPTPRVSIGFSSRNGTSAVSFFGSF